MKTSLLLFAFLGSFLWISDVVLSQENPFFSYDSDQDRDTCQMVRARGTLLNPYICEEVEIEVGQGYKILLHHIPPVPGSWPTGKRPVILQPGLTGSSSNFVIGNRTVPISASVMGNNLGIEMAKRGYDVWISNNRGNRYGLRHVNPFMTQYNPEFWDWTWDDISEFDTPAIVNWVLTRTGAAKVHFVGHSQGSAVMFALLSRDQSMNAKIASFTAINPITYIDGATTTFRAFVKFISPGLEAADGKVGVFTKNFISDTLTPLACSFFPLNIGCAFVWWSLVGPDVHDLDISRLPVYMSHQPTSTSGKNLLHFDQMFDTGEFKRYDYGSDPFFGNQHYYGQDEPPKYKLNEITHPHITVIYTANDWYVPVAGVNKLKLDLPSAQFVLLDDPKANHMDPLIGKTNAVETNGIVYNVLNANNAN